MTLRAVYKHLPRYVLAAGALGLLLRLWLLSSTDEHGFLNANPVATVLLVVLAVGVPAVLFYLTRGLTEAKKYSFNFPPSPIAAIGTGLAALSIGIHSIVSLPGSLGTIDILSGILGILSAAALGLAGWSRFQGRRPNFLLHGVVDIYLMLRLICQYRHWSADPQMLDYCFQILATVGLLMAVYHRSAFDAGEGKRSSYAFFCLTTAFSCCLSLVGWEDILYYLGIGAWMITDLCNLTPLKGRGMFHRGENHDPA